MANEEYSGVQKAAILLIALGPEKSANIFNNKKSICDNTIIANAIQIKFN